MAEYYINFTESRKEISLNLQFVNWVKIYQFKVKGSEINTNPFCLGNISKEITVDNMKKTSLYGTVYNFSVDYDCIDIDDILDIYK